MVRAVLKLAPFWSKRLTNSPKEFDIYIFLIGKIHEHMKTRKSGLACFLTFIWICLQVCAAVYAQISLFVLFASGLTGGTCEVAAPPTDAPEGPILKFCLCVTSLRFVSAIAGEMDSASVGEKCLRRLSCECVSDQCSQAPLLMNMLSSLR